MRERHRYLRGMAGWIGYDPCRYIEYKPESAGSRAVPSTQLTRMFRLAMDGHLLVLNPTAHVRGLGSGGAQWLSSSLFCTQSVSPVCVGARPGVDVQGWTTLVVALLVFSGIQLLTIGVMGEYIGRIYEESAWPAAVPSRGRDQLAGAEQGGEAR